MNRLVEIGFKDAGRWQLLDGKLAYHLDAHAKLRNVLYAFVCEDEVKYIGKTLQALATRMIGYRTPAKSGQSTNNRNHTEIKQLLNANKDVRIMALADNGLHRYGQFHLNMAAGLEDSLIAIIGPEWNGGKRSEPSEDVPPPPSATPVVPVVAKFKLVVTKAYYEQGFFNVKRVDDALFGAHEQSIEIFLGTATVPVLGMINRTAQSNGTARVMGRRPLRDWFKDHCDVGETVEVEVLGPTAIRILNHN